MTRIQPEYFIEIYRDDYSTNQEDSIKHNSDADTPIFVIDFLISELELSVSLNFTTIAIFLIKRQQSTLAERLEARKVNNNLK